MLQLTYWTWTFKHVITTWLFRGISPPLSPLYFILALELILKDHDTNPDKGVNFGGKTLHTLGYADDAALVDGSINVSTERVTAIAQGSRASHGSGI